MGKRIEDSIAHTVLFWLKEPTNTTVRTKFESELKKLVADSQHITYHHIGSPASTDRPVIDRSYTYCLFVTFSGMEAHDKYQVEPAHKHFLAECKELWEKVVIYDSENLQ